VRLVFRYNTGILRGQLRVVGGALPEGMSIAVNARSAGSSPMSSAQSAQVGARGQFVIRGLAPGEYEVVAVAIPRGAVPPELVRQIRQQLIQAKQLVTVTEGTEAQITLVVDLSRRENQQ